MRKVQQKLFKSEQQVVLQLLEISKFFDDAPFPISVFDLVLEHDSPEFPAMLLDEALREDHLSRILEDFDEGISCDIFE